jgi:hypothetical protein
MGNFTDLFTRAATTAAANCCCSGSAMR